MDYCDLLFTRMAAEEFIEVDMPKKEQVRQANTMTMKIKLEAG